MPKYDGVIVQTPNTSQYEILKNIQMGSTVLEFGCATGYMTRYMKEELNCKVTIVEYDAESYEMAKGYAEDGICGDILDFMWYEKFHDKRYDAILFADVLEHLSRPDRVLSTAAKLLKITGHVYISIPNITHNDILLKSYGDRFDYTGQGLLDDTHVHFWGFRNLWELAERAGLKVERVTATYQETGTTEQKPLAMDDRGPNSALLTRLLRQRRFGEVYQFILSLVQSNVKETEEKFQEPAIISHLYLDTGNGFNAQQILYLPGYSLQSNGIYHVHYELPATPGLRNIRFDPVENQGCILRSLAITQEGHALTFQPVHGVVQEQGILLPDSDPKILVENISAQASVVLDAEIQLVGEEYLAALEQVCRRFEEQEGALFLQKREQEKERERQQAELDALRAENSRLQELLKLQRSRYAEEKQKLNQETRKLQQANDVLTQVSKQMKADVDAYALLVINKEKYILRLQEELTEAESTRKFIQRKLHAPLHKVKQLLGR